mgnify:CR=1 FL=1|tara:strand:- start:1863 stop:2444 length:582 start_codon:yes stop_codon:yes gene_type:complete
MAKINMKGLQREIAGQYSVKFRRAIERTIRRDVNKTKMKMLAEFDNHSVTRDLQGGSSTFPGGGDLFSFIGFNSGDKPTSALRALLLKSLRVKFIKTSRMETEVVFDISLPSMSEIEALTPMPWAPGRSWAKEIETGISGLGQYLVKDSPSSRSGKAIQVKGTIRSSDMSGKPYMTEILGNLIKNLTSNLDIT